MVALSRALERSIRIVTLGLLCAATSALAADLNETSLRPSVDPTPAADAPFFNELRLGGIYHGIGNPERNTPDVNVELLTRKLFPAADPDWDWLIPRLHVGGNINTDGRTSDGYAGLTWTWEDVPFDQTFTEFSFGGSGNDGYTGRLAPFTHAKVGCTALFRESGSLGYHLTEHWSLMATIEHISNGGLCDENRGITSAGVRMGYTF